MTATTRELEARPRDRSGWDTGPWDSEPDHVQFEAHGFPCLIHRGPMGAWCGYVGVPPGHPFHGIDYGVPDVIVHGGLTYGGLCRGEICHVAKPGEPEDVWWLGFDCSHSGDASPGYPTRMRAAMKAICGAEYRDQAYVTAETQALAAQLACVAE